MAATKRIPIKKSLYKALKYITASEKTDTEILVTGLNGCSSDPKSAFTQMRFTKQYFEKKDKIQAHHFIQSFVPGEVTFEVAHEIGEKWAKEIFGDNFQGILSTHIDRDHIHNHIIINSVSHIDGKKYDANKGEYKLIREKSDNLCKEYNLSIIDTDKSKSTDKNKRKSQKEYHDFWKEEQNKKQSTIKEDIDSTISVSKDFEDFISKMKKQGYEIKYGKNIKYISFKKLDSKSVRGKSIGEEYTEENIRKRIENKEIYTPDIKSFKEKASSGTTQKYTCKNKEVFIRNKKYYKKNKFRYGSYTWNYARPSSRNSLLVLLILLKTKKKYDKKKINVSPVKIYNNQRVLDNNIRNIQSNINLINRYDFKSISDINTAIKKIEENKKDNFNNIKLLEENILSKKMIYDMTEDYIKYKPAYRKYKNETEIKTPDSQKFVNIYHTLKSLGIDNETQILEYRAAYENIIEDLDNDITDLKEMNKNFNKEKYQLEKIRETVMDMKMKKYNIELEKEELPEKEEKYKSFIVNTKDKDKDKDKDKNKNKRKDYDIDI